MNTDFQKHIFAHNLKLLRGDLGLTQQEVAACTQLSLRAYQSLESGKGNPTLETVGLVAEFFQASSSRLFQLVSVRLPVDFGSFLLRYKKAFDEHPFPVLLRAPNGIALWGNQSMKKVLPPETQWPVDLLKLLAATPDTLSVFRAQQRCEEQGIAQPSLYLAPYPQLGERTFYRLYPTLILPNIGNRLAWISTLSLDLLNECNSNYFNYFNLLLGCF